MCDKKKAAIKFWCKLVGQPAAGVCARSLLQVDLKQKKLKKKKKKKLFLC